MSKTLSDFIKDIAAKAGVKSDDKSLQHLIGMTELQSVEVPDDLLPQFEQNIHSEASAKAKFGNSFRKEAYDAIDGRMETIASELGLDEATIAAIKAESSTPNRVSALAKMITELQAAKSTAKGVDKADIQEQINALKAEKATLAADYESKLKAKDAEFDSILTNKSLESLLSGYKLTIPDEVPADLRFQTALNSINSFLSEKGLKLQRENSTIKVITTADGSDAYDEKNNKYEVKSVLDLALSRHNLLKKNEPAKVDINPFKATIDAGGKTTDVKALDTIDSQLEALKGMNFNNFNQ